MIPLKLSIKGLYSYQSMQQIDFRPLTDAGLFGLFGSVGSGKSTVLEALTFALYGKTDRLNLSGDNRNYNMMNLRSSELLIDFEFAAGKLNTTYRVIVKGRRNRNNFEEVKKLDRQAYRGENGEWIPVDAATIEQTIGLSYDNFKRTIIIPQGQFQEFLQLGDKDRTRMMKELFHLEKYELYPRVVALEDTNKSQLQFLEGQLQQLGTIDPEQIAAMEKQHQELTVVHQQKTEHLRQLRERYQHMEQLQLLGERQQFLLKEQQKLTLQEEEVGRLARKIELYEKASMQFRYLLEQQGGLQADKIRKREQQDELQHKIARLTELCQKLENEQKELAPKYEQREISHQKIADLQLILQIREVSEKIIHDEQRLGKGLPMVNLTKGLVQQLIDRRDELDRHLGEQQKQQIDLSELLEIQSWHVARQSLSRQLEEMQNEAARQLKDQQAVHELFRGEVAKDWFQGVLPPATIADGIDWLGNHAKMLQQKRKQLQSRQQECLVQLRLKDFAVKLNEGEPCPLCGSAHHPQLYSVADSADLLARTDKELRECDAGEEKVTQLIRHFSDLQNRLNYQDEEFQKMNARLKEQQKVLIRHEEAYCWPYPEWKDSEVLQTKLREAREKQQLLQTTQKKLNELNKSLERKRDDLGRFQKGVDQIRNEMALSQKERDTLIQQLKHLHTDDLVTMDVVCIRQSVVRQEQELQLIEQRFTTLTNLLNGNERQLAVDRNQQSTHKKELEEVEQRLVVLQQRLDKELDKSTFKSLDDVRGVLKEKIDLEAVRKQVNDFRNQQLLVKDQLLQLEKLLQGQIYGADKLVRLREDLKAEEQQMHDRISELSRLSQTIDRMKEDFQKRENIQKELTRQQERADNLRLMKSLFKGSGFVNYISSAYLQNLCRAANDRFFRLTRQRLSLELSMDNNFQIRDFMNGGKLRSVKTLSGGQTFQAALSLALALADNIQQVTESGQNFFFLDEGFGSLDKESLQVVFATLKSLRKENRIVGVISHVEEMQQEIDVHLRIQNSSELGSQIFPSWES